MKTIRIALLSLTAAMVSLSAETNVVGTSFTFTIPDDMSIDQGEGVEFYSFQWKNPEGFRLFMLHKHPVPMSPDELKNMADMMGANFENAMKTQKDGVEITKNRTDVELGPFKGIELEFLIKHSDTLTTHQYMFVLHDGTAAWNAQFTAQDADALATVHAILKKARPNKDPAETEL